MEYYTINVDLTIGKYKDSDVARREVERIMQELLDSDEILDWDLNDMSLLIDTEDY